VQVDRDTAARLGISSQLIDDTLYDASAAAGGHDVHAGQPVPRGAGVKPEFQNTPTRCSSLRALGDGRAGAALRAGQDEAGGDFAER